MRGRMQCNLVVGASSNRGQKYILHTLTSVFWRSRASSVLVQP